MAESATAQSRPSPPGELIDVAGHKVHLYCTGQGSSTVVVASGGFSFDWGLVQPVVSQWTRICAYDPAGTAWSDRVEGKDHPTCTDRVDELHELLKNARIDGPYVMVGFSIGGLVARLYATRYPSEIAGMVLVDHAFIDTGSDSAPSTQGSLSKAELDSPPVLISKTPIVLDLEDDQNFRKLPQRDQELHRWALSIHSIRPTPEDAAVCFSEVDGAEPKQAFPLADTPLAVVSTLYASDRYTKLQHTLLSLSRNSQQFVAQNSTHMVIIDQPEIVVEAIHEVINAAKDHGSIRK
jgi:pimeloyl-ACP methyl ester carboxylesterase